jgi:antiviral helicase SKI2
MRRILPEGVGVHHAGLLPVLKETVELLYSKGLIKVLFATTSFSIGLNMPTRTVVFTDVEKYNDEKKEILTSSEYLQMCGRAGRRGIDTIGNIFLLLGDKQNPPNSTDLVTMLRGSGDHVESKFRLSYKTIISFLSRNIKNIYEFFKESYLENKKLVIMPEVVKRVNSLKEQLANYKKFECIYLGESDQYMRDYLSLNQDIIKIRKKLFSNELLRQKLTPGRIIVYNSKKLKKDIHIMVIKYYSDYDQYRCLTVEKDSKVEYETIEISKHKGKIKDLQYAYFEIYINDIVDILDFTIKLDDKNDLYKDEEEYIFIKQKSLDKYLNDILDVTYKHNPKVLDYNKISKNDVEVYQYLQEKTKKQNAISENKCHTCYLRNDHITFVKEKHDIEEEYTKKNDILAEENLKYYNEFKKRLVILQKLDYIDEENQIKLKGKAAREISSTDCVMISELLLSNLLDKLNVSETVAFLSGFVFSRNEIEIWDPNISEAFSKAVTEFEKILLHITQIEAENEYEENKYNRRVTFSTSYAVYLWMEGAKFKDILEESDLEEGKLYNLIMRLFLFLDEIANFYEIIGSKASEKFKDAKTKLMRDILSCRSLYVQEDVNIDFY